LVGAVAHEPFEKLVSLVKNKGRVKGLTGKGYSYAMAINEIFCRHITLPIQKK
jgi:hypothetical protein